MFWFCFLELYSVWLSALTKYTLELNLASPKEEAQELEEVFA